MTAETILKKSFPADVVAALLEAYREIEGNYALRKWKASELDAGHFVEASRRMIEHVLFGRCTPIGTNLPNFSDAELKKYELASGDESYRQLIPRALKAIFNIRNKRGIGHLGLVSANEMDATFILYTVKWVLAEFVRLASGLSVEQTQKMIDEIVARRLSVLWKHNDVTRVLANHLQARDQVLILLYDTNSQAEETLRASVEYKNETNFRKILGRLHRERLIEFTKGKPIHISAKGVRRTEEILLQLRADGGWV